MGFRLTKWYMDLVTPEGAVVVAHHVKVRAGMLGLSGARFEVVEPSGSWHRQRVSMRAGRVTPPKAEASGIAWDMESPALKLRYEAPARTDSRELYRGDVGSLQWCPVAPAASGRAEIAGRSFEGMGYVERLTMDFSPAKLPIDTLRWGRWIGDAGRSLVWIEWRGPQPLMVVLDNGMNAEARVRSDHEVEVGDARLGLDQATELRHGMLDDTVLSRLGARVRWLFRSLGPWQQTMWLSRGEMRGDTTDGAEPESGWAVHERVELRRGSS